MSFFIFLFFLFSIIFSEKAGPSKRDIRKLQSDDGYSNIRIYVNDNCLGIEPTTPCK